MCEGLVRNTGLNQVQEMDVKEHLKNLPKFDQDKFKKIKEEIIEYVKEKLKLQFFKFCFGRFFFNLFNI